METGSTIIPATNVQICPDWTTCQQAGFLENGPDASTAARGHRLFAGKAGETDFEMTIGDAEARGLLSADRSFAMWTRTRHGSATASRTVVGGRTWESRWGAGTRTRLPGRLPGVPCPGRTGQSET